MNKILFVSVLMVASLSHAIPGANIARCTATDETGKVVEVVNLYQQMIEKDPEENANFFLTAEKIGSQSVDNVFLGPVRHKAFRKASQVIDLSNGVEFAFLTSVGVNQKGKLAAGAVVDLVCTTNLGPF